MPVVLHTTSVAGMKIYRYIYKQSYDMVQLISDFVTL